jgi:hypothetical protein
MKKLYTLVVLLLVVCSGIYAQVPNYLWAKSAGGAEIEEGKSICTDASGNVYVTGYFESPSITFGSTTLVSAGWVDIFVVKYDAAGNVLWATSAGGINYDDATSLATDASAHVYVTGYFWSPSITFGPTTLINDGWVDIFVVKYDAAGNVLWATDAGGAHYDYGLSLATDASGQVYVTGYFMSPSITFGTTTLVSAGWVDIFVVKYDAGGNVLWAKSEGGIDEDYSLCLVTDASGNPYVTGFFWSYSISFGSTTLTNAGVYDVFIVKYDAGGNVLWATGAGGIDIDWGLSLCTHAGGDVYVTGAFTSPSLAFGSTTLTNAGSYDIFVTKLGYVTSMAGSSGHSISILIYPNPSSGLFTIQSQERIHSIEIFNVPGERIYHAEAGLSSVVKVDISGQPAGIYILQLKTEKGTAMEKLMVSE